MRPFWKNPDRDLEKRLHAFRADPPRELVDELESRLTARNRVPVRRLGLSLALVAALLIPFGAFGGFGYASSATKSTFTVLTGVKFGKVGRPSPSITPTTSGSTQYCPKKSTRPCPPGQNKPPEQPPPCPQHPKNGHPCKP